MARDSILPFYGQQTQINLFGRQEGRAAAFLTSQYVTTSTTMITSFFVPKKKRSAEASGTAVDAEAGNDSNPSSSSVTKPTATTSDAALVSPSSIQRPKRTKLTEDTIETPIPKSFDENIKSCNDTNDENKSCNTNDNENNTPKATTSVIPFPAASTEVQELLSSLHDPGWMEELLPTFQQSSFARLAKFVAQERRSHTVYPPAKDTWTALNLCPLDEVKVVILGQDPYHGPGQAHGLCFSVLPGQALPASLRNIYLELGKDPNVNFGSANNPGQRPSHGHLIRWSKQGVLLLNTVLSVQRGKAHSHKEKGWENVVGAILRSLFSYAQNKKQGKIVFMVWGKPALDRIQKAKNAAAATATKSANRRNPVLISNSHPSPLSAHKTKTPFVGSRCFSRCNTALQEMGLSPIDWNVDGPIIPNQSSLSE